MEGDRYLLQNALYDSGRFFDARSVDLVLVCSDGSVGTHRLLLYTLIPFFRDIFQESPECNTLVLPDVKKATVHHLVDLLSTGEAHMMDADMQELGSLFAMFNFNPQELNLYNIHDGSDAYSDSDVEIVYEALSKKEVPHIINSQPREQASADSQPREQASADSQPREQASANSQPREHASANSQPREQPSANSQQMNVPTGSMMPWQVSQTSSPALTRETTMLHRFKCKRCRGEFVNLLLLRSHQCDNVRNKFECNDCTQAFPKRHLLNRHKHQNHNIRGSKTSSTRGQRRAPQTYTPY